jgi:Schlafen, AlbA_2
MSTLEHLVRYESPHSGLDFRRAIYRLDEDACLIADCIALANADIKGRRFVFLGVDERGAGDREIVGVDEHELKRFRQRFRDLARTSIEPAVNATVRALRVDGQLIAYIRIKDCVLQPYLAKQDLGAGLKAGMGFVRRGARNCPLQRSDMQRMFAKSREALPPKPAIRIGFAGKEPISEITLAVLNVGKLPSQLAAERLEGLLSAHSEARDVFGRTETRLSRLVHARLYGMEVPYRKRSDSSLVSALATVDADFSAANSHYLFEVRAHKLNFLIANGGDSNLHQARFRVTLPAIEGIGVADRIYTEDETEIAPDGYPRIESTPRTVSLEADLDTLYAGRSIRAFREPARLWVREEAGGKAVPVDYALYADELSDPVEGSLVIYVDEASLKSV